MHDEVVAPSVDLLESMRSVGYSLSAAIADLIDNSITAGAQRIDVDLEPVAAEYIAVLDDGAGMTPDTAREALRLAGSVGERSPSDLGRFGLGLKTASLSQARCLTVITRRDGVTTGLRWDIDYIAATRTWSLQWLSAEELSEVPWYERLDAKESGTLIVLERLDLLVGDAADPGAVIREHTVRLSDDLSLTFHRFLSRRRDRIAIVVNGAEVKPLDPFVTANPRTQESPTQIIPINGENVAVTAFTLPHPSGLTAAERRRPDLGEGMRDAQGFYVYRNERLISHGHWYGLARMTELSKQTRIRVDIPNSLDHLWQLDIKKSRAEPPASFKAELPRLMDGVIERGRRVHTFRGRKSGASDVNHLWQKVQGRDGVRYDVNLENPLVVSVLSALNSTQAERVNRLLTTLADGFPSYDLYAEMARNTSPAKAEPSEEEIEDALRQIKSSAVLGDDIVGVTAALSHTEPFDGVSNLRTIIERVWMESDVDA